MRRRPFPARDTARRAARDERGFAAFWFAMAMVLLLASGALVVDLGYGYVTAQRAQDAADAAALAGTIYLPTDPNAAQQRAAQLAADNGFDPRDPNVSMRAEPVAGQPTELAVTLTKRIPVFFGGIVGVRRMTVTKRATADYDQPVQMGSPWNTFGNQPDCNGCTTGDATPDFWANVEGPDTSKTNGNAFQAGYCDGVSDNCPAGGVNNTDLQPDGAVFAIRNAIAGQSLAITLFDAGFVPVGDQCDDPNLTALHAAMVTFGFPNAARYAPGAWPSVPYCTGDVATAGGASTQPVDTQFTVLQPDATPWTLADNPPEPACPELDLQGVPDAPSAFADPVAFAAWRQWTRLCTIPNAMAGDYMLQVRTTRGAGNNNFAINVAGGIDSQQVSVFGVGRMAIYANAGRQAATRFYLARVLPGAAGRVLRLQLFDIGDALDGSSGTLQVLPPAEATVASGPLAGFSGCRFAAPPGDGRSTSGPPWGSMSATPDGAGPCSVDAVTRTSYNGQWVEWDVPIPDDYSCAYSDPLGCWVRISFGFTGGVLDVTSWRAMLDGNPVRLVR